MVSISGITGHGFMDHDNRQTRLIDLVRPFKRSLGLIIIPFITIVGTVGFLTWMAQPIYESKAAVYIGTADRLSFDADQVAVQRYMVKNQIPILKSRRLAAEVIRRFQNSQYKDSMLILGTRTLPSRFEILSPLISVIKKEDKTKAPPTFIEMVESFRDATKISEQLDTNVILLIARSHSVWEATYMVNTWVDAYLEYDQLLNRGDASENKRFLETKVQEVEINLKKSEKQLMDFQKSENVVALSNETEQLVTQSAQFESEYNKTRTELESVANQLSYLKNQLDESRQHFVDDILKMSTPVLQQLQQQMATLITEKAAYEAQLIGAGLDPDQDVRLAQMESRLNGVRERIIEETSNYMKNTSGGVDPVAHSETLITQILQLETTQQSLEAKSKALKKVVDEYAVKLSELPEKSLRLAQLQRDVQMNRDIYAMLRQKYEEAKIKSTGLGGNIVVLDRGQPPLVPVFPRKRMNLFIACILGLMLGLGLAFARDYFEDYIWEPEDVEALDLKVIGTVPHLKDKTKMRRKADKHDSKIERAKAIYPFLLTQQPPQSSLSEAYRVIRTFLDYKSQKMKAHTILFTSPGPSEGKSTTATNMAIAFAQKGIRTLLVDCDFRKPVLDLLLIGTPCKEGLVSSLRKKIDWIENVRETAVKGLHLLPAGLPIKNASEVLGSKQMFQFFRDVSKHYRLIIIDCPPVLPVTDAAILSEWVDGVVMNIRREKTTRHGLKRAVERLKNVHAHIWGFVLVSMPEDSQYGYHTYYESYHSKPVIK